MSTVTEQHTFRRIAELLGGEYDDTDDLVEGVRLLVQERDEARALKVPATTEEVLQAQADTAVAILERDEARAKLADAKSEWAARKCECGSDDFCAIAKERDAALSEAANLRLALRAADVMRASLQASLVAARKA